ncbi:hypothetical protein, partial [Neisseria dentiae]|uniref:hypothetical protein n=1 Tax=Neisseria dentiae TaxID=194197 RepID=UPI0035A1B8AD
MAVSSFAGFVLLFKRLCHVLQKLGQGGLRGCGLQGFRCRKFQRCLHFPFFACRPILGFLRVVKNAERHGEAASFLRILKNHETIIPAKNKSR